MFTRQYMKLVAFQVFLCSLKEKWYLTLTYNGSFWRLVQRHAQLSSHRIAYHIGVSTAQVL